MTLVNLTEMAFNVEASDKDFVVTYVLLPLVLLR